MLIFDLLNDKFYSIYILFTDQISLSDFIVNCFFPFSTWPKSQDKNLKVLRTKREFKVK